MVNFNIIENAPENYVEKYDLFVELYNNGVLVADIRRLLDWTIKDYRKARKHALDVGDIVDRRINMGLMDTGRTAAPPRTPNYYSYNKNTRKYHIYRTFNGTRVYFASYAREDDAKRAVQVLKSVDWDMDKFQQIMGLN